MTMLADWDALSKQIRNFRHVARFGTVLGSEATIHARLSAAVGDLCQVETREGRKVLTEVIGFRDANCQLLPYEHTDGIAAGGHVRVLGSHGTIPCGDVLLGRVIDGLGRPLDGRGGFPGAVSRALTPVVPSPLRRSPITKPFITGQRAIDGLLTFGRGQRVGLFAGSGVGKSTLLGEIAKYAASDCNVIALIGERGREVRPFVEEVLGPAGLERSVVVVATSDQSPLLRIRAAQAALTIANHFRGEGRDVLFLFDSITRLAAAQREIGILLREPPVARGYTTSVFRLMTQILEQLGTSDRGSITGIVTVLVEGDDTEEPIADAVRAIVDGHIVLDRALAERGHYPAIRISKSVSRLFDHVVGTSQLEAAIRLRQAMATYDEFADMIRLGIYQKGASVELDQAIQLRPAIESFLCQRPGETTAFDQTVLQLQRIAQEWSPLGKGNDASV